jgi:hypothetical protein
MSLCRLFYLGVGAGFVSPLNAADEKNAFRLDDALNTPAWFSISGEHRIRFENLDNQFRAGLDGGDQVLLFRTLVLARLNFDRINFGFEMQDSRGELADEGTPLGTTEINPLELLQAYADIKLDNIFQPGSTGSIRGGRMTMDAGSRRLVARNSYRNTINAFTGIDWIMTTAAGNTLRAFYTLPVQRRVSGNILDNDARFDKEFSSVRFWGLYFAPAALPWGDKGEIFLLGLDEEDDADLATRNRDLYTPGFRIYRNPAKLKFDYQIESVFQFGEARNSTSATDITDLDHFAHFHHVEAGYSVDAAWSPRLVLQFDYASGDDSQVDGDSDRFDTLFGARRFDFGPTSIYGPFARANLISPGGRIIFKPTAATSGFVAFRGFWLADDGDAWTTAGLRNLPGVSENYIGSQIEGSLRWDVVPGNVRVEAGGAYLFAGDFMDDAGKDDVNYLYTQLEFFF